jgi:hypothetical protein
MVSFNVEADKGGVFPYAGALVTLATDADETCVITTTQALFILGVCEESGILQGQINVIVRGVVTVTSDGTTAIQAGDYLDVSTTVDGEVASVTSTPTRMVALTTVAETAGLPVLALLF